MLIDDLYGVSNETGSIQPIEFIDYTDDKCLLDWANKTYELLREASHGRLELYHDNLCRYLGFYRELPYVGQRNSPRGDASDRRFKYPRVVINHTRDLVDQKIAKILRVKTTSQIVPFNSTEHGDKIAAENTDKLLRWIEQQYDMELLKTRVVKRAILAGEGFLKVCWSPDRGPISKSASKNRTIVSEDGEKVTLSESFRMGDVEYSPLKPENVFLIPSSEYTFATCPGVFIRSVEHVDKVRADYPELAQYIHPDNDTNELGIDDQSEGRDKHVTIIEGWYRSSKYLRNGLYFKFCRSCVLESAQDNPIPWTQALEASESGNLPIERITDIDLDDQLHGWSSMHDLNTIQNYYDKITSFIVRNIFIFSTPKWMLPRGSASLEQLSNGSFVCQYSGPQAPALATYPSITQEIFTTWGAFKGFMEQIFGIYSVSRGEAPTGTRSASQLAIYDEQEEENRATIRKKLERFSCAVRAKTIAIISKEYPKKEQRVVGILGSDRSWATEKFDVEDLGKEFVVTSTPTDALPEAKYSRIKTLLEIFQITAQGPEGPMFSMEQLAEAMDFGQNEKFVDYMKISVMAAEAENELLVQGKEVLAPQTYEDLLNHWRVHAKLFQSRKFKQLSKEIQERAIDHMLATEYLIFARMQTTPSFGQHVMSITNFPMFYVQPEPSPMPLESQGQTAQTVGNEQVVVNQEQPQEQMGMMPNG